MAEVTITDIRRTLGVYTEGPLTINNLEIPGNAIQTLADAPIITFDTSISRWAKVILGGNRSIELDNLIPDTGMSGYIFVFQDDTGGRTLSFPVDADLPTSGLGLSSGANELTIIEYIYDGSTVYLRKENYGVSVAPEVDVTPPAVSTAIVGDSAPSHVIIVFSEVVTGVNANGWSFKKNNAVWPISTVTGVGNTWFFNMATPAVNGDTLLRSYNSVTGSTVDTAQTPNELISFTDFAITNNVAEAVDTTPPTLVSASVSNISKDFIDLVYNETLNGGSIPTAGSFTVPGKSVIGVTMSGGMIIRVQVSAPFAYGDTPTISYTAASSPIKDTAGNNAANLVSQAVINNISAPGDVTAPTVNSMFVNDSYADRIYIIVTENLNEASIPATSAFTPSGGKVVTSVQISGSVVVLFLNGAYGSGDTITLSYTAPGSNMLKDLAGNNLANFTTQPVTNDVSGAGLVLPTEAILLLVSGQSNAVGRAANSASEVAVTNNTAYEYRPDTNSLKWLVDPTGQPGQYWTATDNSFNPNLAKRLYELTGKDVIVVVSGRGNTGIDTWTNKTSPEYVNMKTFWNQLIAYCTANSITVSGKYAVWHQGENDAGVKEVDAYMSSLNTVVDNFITDIVVDQVFVGRIGYNPSYASDANSEKIMKAQNYLNFIKDQMILASKAPSQFTVGNGKMAADNVHYTVVGLNELGEDYAEAIQEFRANNKKINVSTEPVVALQDPGGYFDDIYNFRSMKAGVNNADYNELWGRNNLTLVSGTPVFDEKNGLINSSYSMLTPATARTLLNTHDWTIEITFRATSTTPGMVLNGRDTAYSEDWVWINAATTIQLRGNAVAKTSAAITNANWGQPTSLAIVYTYLNNTVKIYHNGAFDQSFSDWVFTSLKIDAILRGSAAAPTANSFNGYMERIRIVKRALDAWELDKSPNIGANLLFDYDFQFNGNLSEAQGEITSDVRLYSTNAVSAATYDADGIVLTATTDYFKLARQLNLVNQDCTIEIRCKNTPGTGTQYLLHGGIQPSDATGSTVYLTGAPHSGLTANFNGNVSWVLTSFDSTIFHTYKFVYNKTLNTIELFIDGVSLGAKTGNMTTARLTSIGAGPTAGSRFTGTIDYFKVKNSL